MEEITEAGIRVVAISYDSLETIKAFSDKYELSYLFLSDEGSKTIDAYGIRNEAMDGKKFGPNDLSGIPHPGTYVLDSKGVVRAKIFLERYQERHEVDALIEAAKSID